MLAGQGTAGKGQHVDDLKAKFEGQQRVLEEVGLGIRGKGDMRK